MTNAAGHHWIRDKRRFQIYIRDNWLCVYCQCNLALANILPGLRTLDHILPRDLGGSNDTHNLVTSCGACNGSRGNGPLLGWVVRRFPNDWFEVLERVSKAQDTPLAPLAPSALNDLRQLNRVLT